MIGYFIHIITLIAIYIMVALSYAIPVGYTGLLNLGHVGLLAIGAYTAAILTTSGISFWIALAAAAIVTGAAGFLLALPTRRIKGDYYTLMTLGFTFVVNAVMLNWIKVTRGPFGISGIDRPPGFTTSTSFLFLTLLFVVLIAIFVYRVVKSPFGKALEAVRDDDLVAESLGKPVAKLRLTALVVSAIIVGIAGAFLAHFIRFINPQIFWLDNVVWILAAIVIGGLASFRGAILGMIIMFLIFEPLRFLHLPPDLVGALRLIIFSLLLLLVVMFKPKGLFGRAQFEQ